MNWPIYWSLKWKTNSCLMSVKNGSDSPTHIYSVLFSRNPFCPIKILTTRLSLGYRWSFKNDFLILLRKKQFWNHNRVFMTCRTYHSTLSSLFKAKKKTQTNEFAKILEFKVASKYLLHENQKPFWLTYPHTHCPFSQSSTHPVPLPYKNLTYASAFMVSQEFLKCFCNFIPEKINLEPKPCFNDMSTISFHLELPNKSKRNKLKQTIIFPNKSE